jgi:hypothetical protein
MHAFSVCRQCFTGHALHDVSVFHMSRPAIAGNFVAFSLCDAQQLEPTNRNCFVYRKLCADIFAVRSCA